MSVRRSAALTNSPSDNLVDPTILRFPIIGWSDPSERSITATDEDSSFPVANLLNQSTHLRWASSDFNGDAYLSVTGLPDTTNYVAFAAHNFNGFDITIFGHFSGNSPDQFFTIFEQTTMTSNTPQLFEFVEDDYDQILVKISGNGVRTAAIMHCGLLMRFDRGVKVDVDHAPIALAQKTDVLTGFSESGNFLGRLVRNQIFETKYEFSNFTPEWFGSDEPDKAMWAFLKYYAPIAPFFICWAPQDYGGDLGFVWLTQDAIPTQNPVTRRWSVTLQVRGYASGD